MSFSCRHRQRLDIFNRIVLESTHQVEVPGIKAHAPFGFNFGNDLSSIAGGGGRSVAGA